MLYNSLCTDMDILMVCTHIVHSFYTDTDTLMVCTLIVHTLYTDTDILMVCTHTETPPSVNWRLCMLDNSFTQTRTSLWLVHTPEHTLYTDTSIWFVHTLYTRSTHMLYTHVVLYFHRRAAK